MIKKVHFQNLGLIDYKEAWDFQEKLFNQSAEKKMHNRKNPEDQLPISNYLLFCEHPHVYTLGKSGDTNHLLINDEELGENQATFYKINRGGDITYHGPGQLVGYPILDLDQFFTDIHKYLRYLEEAIILTLKEYGVEGGRIDGLTGVWIDHADPAKARKICAMGVRCSRWITMHGFALNVNTNLNYFENIVPCGISDKKVTSLALETGKNISVEDIGEVVKKHLATLFEMEFSNLSSTQP
ncbi:MAG: lipoyl(octanoyl) transferase LipB [Bacteroidetes bacterium]|nr:lipoyl(octanoyl) transferase LipB [Bacteroidota bacterium]